MNRLPPRRPMVLVAAAAALAVLAGFGVAKYWIGLPLALAGAAEPRLPVERPPHRLIEPTQSTAQARLRPSRSCCRSWNR
jgi:hypothetical protein